MNKNAKVAGNNTVDKCAACDIDLATCDTIWAAEGALYCSRECGIEDFKHKYGDDAERCFNDVAEEVTPEDIGITRTEVFGAYSKHHDLTTIFKDTYRCVNDTLVSTEAVGFYHGAPCDDDTETYTGNLKAMYE